MPKRGRGSETYRYSVFLGGFLVFLFGISACDQAKDRKNAEMAEWINQGYRLMASRGAWQRALAETLLLSAWENRSLLSRSSQATLALRLAHLLERNADPKRSW